MTLHGGAAVCMAARGSARQSKVARIGALYLGIAESFKTELHEGLRELGFLEGQNLAFDSAHAR
jgi:hypothetical protein